MTNARRGSLLLLCLAIVAALAMIAYAFVRVVQLHNESNTSVNRQLLAREAALMGAAHAFEEISRDYATEPFTHLDGPAHAIFTSHSQPYGRNPSDIDALTPGGSGQVDVDDVGGENVIYAPTKDTWWDGYLDQWGAYTNGMFTYDGRGRYYEPEFYNRAAYQAGAPPKPTKPIRFGTDVATADLPDRRDGIFYDEHWRRITGDPAAARTRARYRLRYVVGVIDMDGSILINPDPGFDPSQFNNPDPRTFEPGQPLVARVVRAQHALPSIGWIRSQFGMESDEGTGTLGGISHGVRVEHIFLGRGSTTNYDSSAAKNYMPMTFPMSYRPNAAGHFNFLEPQVARTWRGGSYNGSRPAEALYANAAATVPITGQMGGGEPIKQGPYPYHMELSHVLTGPQYSFNNFDQCTWGDWGEGLHGRDGTVRSLGFYTPFGRGMTKGTPYSRYVGKVDTPWCVNLMTAPPRVAFSMIAAYMPAGTFCAYYHAKAPNEAKSYYADLNVGRDFFVRELSPAFSRYTGPTRPASGPNPAIAPDYHIKSSHPTDPAYRRPENRYPGIMAFNGYSPNKRPAYNEWANDSLGRYLRATGTIAAPNKEGEGGSVWGGAANYSATATATATTATTITVTITSGGSGYSVGGTTVTLSGGGGTYTSATPTIVAGAVTAVTVVGAAGYTPTAAVTVDIVGAPAYSSGKVLGARDPFTGSRFWETYIQRADFWFAGGTLQPYTVDGSNLVHDGPWDGWPVDRFQGIPGNTGGAIIDWDWSAAGAHPDSIWESIGQAMAATLSAARGQWMLYPTPNGDPATWFNGGAWTNPATKVRTIRDVDALFLANLGINIAAPASAPPANSAWTSTANGLRSFTPAWNLATLAAEPLFVDNFGPAPGTYSAGSAVPPFTSAERTQAMELIINDFRLSFFGSSPEYADAFRALDLNGDRKVACSGFPANGSASARETALGINQYVAVASPGDAAGPVTDYFSHSGVFFIGKSRYWRVFVRGEVWDNLSRGPISESVLETVMSVDPVDRAKEWQASPSPAADAAAGQYSNHVLFQRWYYEKYRGRMPRRY